MITVLTLLQEESSRLKQFRNETAGMLAVCQSMARSASRTELHSHQREFRKMAAAQDEREYRHGLRVRGISKRLNLQ